MEEKYEDLLLKCNNMKELDELKKKIIKKNLILSCDNIEQLQNLKRNIKLKRNLIQYKNECTHLCGYFIDTIIDYESYTEYKCLRCGEIKSHFKIAILGGVQNKKINNKVANIFMDLYRKLYFEGIEENDIIEKLQKFDEFLKSRNVINYDNYEELEEIILDEWNRFNEINKILEKERKK